MDDGWMHRQLVKVIYDEHRVDGWMDEAQVDELAETLSIYKGNIAVMTCIAHSTCFYLV